ncbi:hypothetical protein KIN20_029485 [Parelaphostrongylus tenuis]|uniref:Uncharacterized protein n=1 Tax=Parelaphostrongylus tenuis TaxID=148309 RepID=A0AAD5R2P5_PARTN|nr:hypothetical protein KIN20_029485 [Parelaphostrongylus tenuis]
MDVSSSIAMIWAADRSKWRCMSSDDSKALIKRRKRAFLEGLKMGAARGKAHKMICTQRSYTTKLMT